MSDVGDLEALDDAALARLAYGRANGDENRRMLAERAARILTARKQAAAEAEAARPAVAAPSAATAGPTPAMARSSAAATPQSPELGVDEPAPTDDELPVARDRAPRWVLVTAAAAAGALMIGALVGQLAPSTPPAFAVFEASDMTASDTTAVRYAEQLTAAGERLLTGARIIATTELPDGGRVDLVAYRSGREGDPAENRSACVAVFGTLGEEGAASRRWERTCTSEPDFLAAGIEATLSLTGVEVRYAWPADPAVPPSIEYAPTGPRSVAESLDLAGDALGTLRPQNEAEPPPLVASIMTAVRPENRGAVLLGPTELAREGDEAILIGYLSPGSLPGAELSVCAAAVRLGVAWGEIDERCVPVSDFAESGLGTEQSPNAGVGVFSYRWEPTGDTSLTVLRP